MTEINKEEKRHRIYVENPKREKPWAEETTEKSTIINDVTRLRNGEIDEEITD